MLALRQSLAESIQVKAAQQFAQQFSQTSLFQDSQRIAFYLPFEGELDPSILLKQAWQQNKQCFLPVLLSNTALGSLGQMVFFSYCPGDTLNMNRYGILEPDPKNAEKCLPEDLDLVLVPLVAFDDQYNRLGMGAGYYDKTFAFLRPKRRPYLLGLAYSFQHCLELPIDPWDVILDGVWKVDVVYSRL